MKIAIIIPARYGSTRFPGKPLALLNGTAMIDRVVALAKEAINGYSSASIMVATDDERIVEHCKVQGHECLMTSVDCKTGSDRVLDAAVKLTETPDVVLNLQGDAPLMPVSAIRGVIEAFTDPDCHVATPIKQLTWVELDRLRTNKETTRFSGTTVTITSKNRSLWFSKNILPAIRKEDVIRGQGELSPVHQHLGLYGYRLDVLRKFVNLPEGRYEALEGLEQLRFLENEIPITCVSIPVDEIIHSGIDSPEDLERAERLLNT